MLKDFIEFQIEDILEKENNFIRVYGRCSSDTIFIKDVFKYICKRRCMEKGSNYKEISSKKFPVFIEVEKIEYMHRQVEKIERGVSGVLTINVIKNGLLDIAPKSVLSN